MTDLEDIIAKARAAIGRKVRTADMLRVLEEREQIIERLLQKIEALELDKITSACQVQRMAQRSERMQ